MARPWSKVTKLVQAEDGAGLVELLCRSPPIKEERLAQVFEGLEGLPVARVLPPLLQALGHSRLPSPEMAPRLERIIVDKCRQDGLVLLFNLVRNDHKIRTLAHEFLVRLGPSRALEPLIGMLADKDAELRSWSREVIRAYDPFITVPTLIECLEGPADLRQGVVETLGQIRDPQALKPLVDLLGKARGPLRETVQRALVQYRAQAIEPLLSAMTRGGKSQREGAIETLERLGDLPVSTRVKIHLYQGAEEELRQIGSQAFETLREALEWKDPRHRFLAAKLLGEMEDERVLPILERLLADSDPPVRHVALESLGKLGQTTTLPSTLPSLLKGLEDSHDEVARTAALALGRLGQPGFQGLVEALESEDPRVSQRAGKALLNLGGEAIEPLWAALDSKRSPLMARAAEILGRTPDLDLARKVELFLRQGKPGSLVQLGQEAIPLVVEALGDTDDDRQGTAIAALEQMGAKTVQYLVKTLAEEDLRRRRASLRILTNLGQPAYEGLLKALEANDARIRRDAVRALGLLREGKALSALTHALEDPEPRVAREAAQALVQLGVPGIKRLGKTGSQWGVGPLRDLLKEGARMVTETTQALVGVGAPAREALEEALNHHQTRVRLQAAQALGELEEGASAPALLKSLSDEDPAVRTAARESLIRLRTRALPSLLMGLKSPHWFVRREASLALGGIGDPRTLGPLIERLGDSDREVQSAVIEAIENFEVKALDHLLKGFDEAPRKEQDARRKLLARLGGSNVETLVERHLAGNGPLVLQELLIDLAPMGLMGQRLEALGRKDEARWWFDRSGTDDDRARLHSEAPSSDPPSEVSLSDMLGRGPGEVRIPDPQEVESESKPLSRAWEPTSDVSAQLQRLIIAHKEGALTDQEFARAKAKLLGL